VWGVVTGCGNLQRERRADNRERKGTGQRSSRETRGRGAGKRKPPESTDAPGLDGQARRMAVGDAGNLLGEPLPGVRIAVLPCEQVPQPEPQQLPVPAQLLPFPLPERWPRPSPGSHAWETGELVIVGLQVAKGYTGSPETSASKFGEIEAGGAIRGPGPVQEGQRRGLEPQAPTERFVRTGDLVRRTDAGLVFVGRVDRQVKLHGVRCNPAEAEAVLRSW
jgi:acyl-CoA synthetase (AMP-forming)/AMP-acid ligase II